MSSSVNNKSGGRVSNAAIRTESAANAKAPRRTETTSTFPSILVVVASYGQENDVHLRRLLAEFRSMPFRADVHVLSNVNKDLGLDVTMHVGLPTRNPRSLPFAYRRLFAEHLTSADYFIYCEDDTLITERNIHAFIEVNNALQDDEIPGFLRVETVEGGKCYVESVHGPYRWDIGSLVRRGAWTFASFTNHHSACLMASRAQVQRAIASGGFLVKPHIGRFAMLESAVCDLYTQCGLNRLMCVSRIEDFLVPHLSNKNCPKWGVPCKEFMAQTRALEQVGSDGGSKRSLMEVETRMPRGWWSKNLYERPDPTLLRLIPGNAKTLLAVGSGWGATEEELIKQGKKVTGIPVDGVFGDCLRRRGINTVEGPFEEAMHRLQNQQFDIVLLPDMIHLLPEPVEWLLRLKSLIGPTGALLASVPRTFDPLRMVWFFRGEPATAFPKRFVESRVQRVNHSRLVRWFTAAGMDVQVFDTCNTPRRRFIAGTMRGLWDRSLTDRLIALAKPRIDA